MQFASAANVLLNHQVVAANGYKTFIPSLYANLTGIARNVPKEWSMEEIMECTISSSRIINVERMTFWDNEAKVAKPSESIKITFRSYKLPSEIKLYNVLTKITPFVPKTLFCKNCLKYGHTTNYCKANKICQKCTSKDHIDDCNSEPKCNYCPDEVHMTNDINCQEKKNQIEIKKTMVTEKIPFFEANKIVRKKIRESKTKSKAEKDAEFSAILKSQNEENDGILKAISNEILNRKSDSTECNSSTMLSKINTIIYKYITKNHSTQS